MSNNNLVHDMNNTALQRERNCINMDLTKNLKLHTKTNLVDDKCFIDTNTVQSMCPTFPYFFDFFHVFYFLFHLFLQIILKHHLCHFYFLIMRISF